MSHFPPEQPSVQVESLSHFMLQSPPAQDSLQVELDLHESLHLPSLQSVLADAVALEPLDAALPEELVPLALVALVVGPLEPDDPEAPASLPLPEAFCAIPAEELAVASEVSGSVVVDSLELVFDVGSEFGTDPCVTVQLARTRAPPMKLISAMWAHFMLGKRPDASGIMKRAEQNMSARFARFFT